MFSTKYRAASVTFLGVAAAAFLAGCGGGGGGGTPPAGGRPGRGFEAPVPREIGGSPAAALAADDFNEDGWPDLVTLDAASGRVNVLFGGRGGLDAPAERGAADSPVQCLAADFDRDGHADLAVLQGSARAFTVFRGKGDGTFEAGRAYPLRARGVRMAAADVDGDRFPDLAVVAANGSADGFRVSLFRGSAAGAFEEWWNDLDAMQNVRDVAISDVDRDGARDLVLSFWEEGEPVWVFPGRGDGLFRDPMRLPALAVNPDRHDGTNRVAAADVTGDGRPDLVTTHDVGSYQMVAVRPSRAGGGFGEAVRLTTDRPDSVVVNDLNGDDLPDIAVANLASSTVTCYLNRGGGRFPEGRAFTLGGVELRPAALAFGDFNRDGSADLAVLNQGPAAVSVLYGTNW